MLKFIRLNFSSFVMKFLGCILLGFTLLGCVSHNLLQNNAGNSTTRCDHICLKQALACQNKCSKNCPSCQAQVEKRANLDDQEYVYARKTQGMRVAREVDSFRDPLACKKVTCDCAVDYDTCKKRCRGRVNINAKSKSCCEPNHLAENRLRDVLGG